MDKLKNIHPGEIFLEKFLLPMEISQTKLANSIDVSPRRINEIVLGKRGITADTALHIAKVFGSSMQFWMGLQDEYELLEARSAVKRIFGFAKVSYRDMLKNGNRLFVVVALANLFMAPQHLLRHSQERCV